MIAVSAAAATLLMLVAPVARPVPARATGIAVLHTAVAAVGRPTVGPIFHGPVTGTHSCTASVIDSSTGDLILTAAHCVSGPGTDIRFAPGYRDGHTPYGVWRVTEAYADPAWITAQDPHDDYAVLRVVPDGGGAHGSIQQATGGFPVAAAPRRETPITVIGYNAGVGGTASSCRTRLYWDDGFPTFSCAGFVGGSSGSPWLMKGPLGSTEVVGVIGGLYQGGCLSFISRAPDFRQDVLDLVSRAAAHRHPDTLPQPEDAGC